MLLVNKRKSPREACSCALQEDLKTSPGLFVVIVTEHANTHPFFFVVVVIANVILIYILSFLLSLSLL